MAHPNRTKKKKKFFTLTEANATLPLLRSILRDLTTLAPHLRDRQERLRRLRDDNSKSLGEAYKEELEQIAAELEQDQAKMEGYYQELVNLGIELKDYFTGLVDFPSIMEGREVYLCWRLGEAEVAYWHELDAGFAGRQKIAANVATR